MSATEFDQLLSQDGILMAGRFGPGWTVTDHELRRLLHEEKSTNV